MSELSDKYNILPVPRACRECGRMLDEELCGDLCYTSDFSTAYFCSRKCAETYAVEMEKGNRIHSLNFIKWHNYPEEKPDTNVGSFLILKDDGDIAEAEYRENGWFQYRWSAPLGFKHVVAWCSFDSIRESMM